MRYAPYGWTPEREQFVIDTAAALTTAQQAARLGMSPNAVKERRSLLRAQGRLTTPGGAGFRPWTPQEDDDLRELIAEGLPPIAVIRRFRQRHKRTENAVRNRIDRLGGLTAMRAPRAILRIWSQHEVADLFGASIHLPGIWIRRGWLHADYSRRRRNYERRGGPRALITDAALADFLLVRAAWPSYDPARITDPIWREVAQEARAEAGGHWVRATDLARAWGFAPLGFARLITDCPWPLTTTMWGKANYVWSADVPTLRAYVDHPKPRPRRAAAAD